VIDNSKITADAAKLRRKAENKIASQPAHDGELDAIRLFHELQVHQIELEMQYDELQKSKQSLDLLRKFVTLDHAKGGRRSTAQRSHDKVDTPPINLIQQKAKQNPLRALSQRELETLKHVAEGKTNAVIGVLMGISIKSAETYRSRLMNKLGINNVPGLVKFALLHGVISL